MATVYAVASAKGGVGKTTTTAAIATILADSGADVVAIDVDLGMANFAGAVGVTPGETTLHDVLAGQADPLDAVHDGPAGLRVVPGAADLDAYAAADPSGLKAVIDAFDDADYVFVDAGAGLSHDSTLPLGLADETLLVSTAERAALGDTEKTRQLTERLGGTVAGAAITRVGAGSDFDDVTETLDATVLGRIPEDEAVMRAVAANEPLPTFAPDATATRAYRDLTRALTGAAIEGVGLGADVAGGDAEPDEPDEPAESESDEEDTPAEGDTSGGGDTQDVERAKQAESIGEAEPIDAAEQADSVAEADEGSASIPDAEATDETGAVDEDDEDLIVAAESSVSEGDEPEDDAAEPEGSGSLVDDDTQTVGEEHVDGDDLEAMIEEEAAFDVKTESAADDDTTADEGSTASSETEIDDEFAGSVPFRDDDTGGMNTVLSESDAEGDDETEPQSDDGGGFFSRLFGR